MHIMMTPTSLVIIVITMIILLDVVSGHFSFVDINSQIACNITADDGINYLSKPIMEGARYSEWWMHGQVSCQSKTHQEGSSFALPANNQTYMVMSSRIELVPPPYGIGKEYVPANPNAVLTRQEWGKDSDDPGNTLGGKHNIHAYTRDDTAGCALAIAYKNNATEILPEDFVIFTVVHDCVKRQREPIDIPNLPACPNNKCICAWFWLPKNSGAKNFYMTPFVCHVTNANMDASPIDYDYAIPPRRCLDPKLCNFGPRQPAYWLGTGDHINMPEDTSQSPSYSILYGFREGAQNDIFINTNPRRHVAVPLPIEPKCSEKKSRITEPAGWTDLTSPNCRCTARRLSYSEATVRIYDGPTLVSTIEIGGNSGPRDLFKNASFKADWRYFPLGERPYRMDLNDKCYLYVTDAKGVVVWESMFNSGHQTKYVLDTFTGMSPDPLEWPVDGTIYTQPPSAIPTVSPMTVKPTSFPTTYHPTSDKPSTHLPSASPTTSKPATSSPMTSHPTTDSPSLVHPSSSSSTSIEIGDSPVTPEPTSRKRGRRRSWPPTQEPTVLPTYWPTFTPTTLVESSPPSPTSTPTVKIMRQRRPRKQNIFASKELAV